MGGSCYIGNVIIAPFARGVGIGKHLIEQMIDIAFFKHQAIEVIVSCFNQNVAGLLFYPKLGFFPYQIEERKDKQGNQVALIHMRLQRK
jgi:ribosomal protein S18 acetylase RimI-like enzyme